MRATIIFALFASTSCIPSFELDQLRFAGDASPVLDALADAAVSDAACPMDASPEDASPEDAVSPPDDGGAPAEICDDGIDNDLDNDTDCADVEDCGDSCDDQNTCTTEACLTPSGMCMRSNNTNSDTLAGWRCEGGIKHETNCLLASGDEDDDGDFNCLDLDCCETLECPGTTCP